MAAKRVPLPHGDPAALGWTETGWRGARPTAILYVMEQIQVTAAFEIPARHRAAFREVAAELIAAVRAREPDTLQYLWYFTEDGARCSVREIYRDSDAVLHHLRNCAEPVSRLLPLGRASFEVCGPVSDALRAALADIAPSILTFHGGVDRLLGE